MAAAVVELAEDGAHLFRLLDLVRLYSIAQGGERYFPALLEEAGQWFAKRGEPDRTARR